MFVLALARVFQYRSFTIDIDVIAVVFNRGGDPSVATRFIFILIRRARENLARLARDGVERPRQRVCVHAIPRLERAPGVRLRRLRRDAAQLAHAVEPDREFR